MNQNKLIIEKLIDALTIQFSGTVPEIMDIHECCIKNLWEMLNVLYDAPIEERNHIKMNIHANSMGKVDITPANMFTACALYFHYKPPHKITNETCMQFKEGRIQCTEGKFYSFIEHTELKIEMKFI